jgi:hypothetical protein
MRRGIVTQQQLRKVFRRLNQFLICADEDAAMSTSLRPPLPGHFSAEPASVEELVGRIADLVLLRQALRANGSEKQILEHNRCELVAAHWELSRALIARHCAARADAESAAA